MTALTILAFTFALDVFQALALRALDTRSVFGGDS